MHLYTIKYFPWHLIGFFFSSFFSEHDLPLEAHLVGDHVKDQNVSFSDKESKQSNAKPAYEDNMALVSQKKGGQRKRGRPAGGGIKKVKPSGNQPRRARAQTVKKRAKLCEYESDESDSGDKRPSEQETDTREGGLESYGKHPEPQETEKHEDVQNAQTVESSEQNKAFKLEDLKDSRYERMPPEIEMTDWDKHSDQNIQVTDKLEILTDPMQAMLFDLIPSLAMKKDEQPMDLNVREEKQPEVSNTGAGPSTKKKKVSYKGIAGALLKDW